MRTTVSFHPIDLEFFDDLVQPLLLGARVNPDEFVVRAQSFRKTALVAARYIRGLEYQLELAEPPPPLEEGSLWDRVRSRLERFDYRADPLTVLVARKIDPDLHLRGRPFLVTEGSTERVSERVEEFVRCEGTAAADALALEQLVKLDPALARGIKPQDEEEPEADIAYRARLLESLKLLHDLARASDAADMWGLESGQREPATTVLGREVPRRALELHSRANPCWIAEDVDGLETVCLAAGVEPPAVLTPAWRLFGDAVERWPSLRETLGVEMRSPGSLGAWVSPGDVSTLLDFLNGAGAAIIREATRHGQGPACGVLLRKIRECATYAAASGRGYVEASGFRPFHLPKPELEEALGAAAV